MYLAPLLETYHYSLSPYKELDFHMESKKNN